MAFEKRHTTGWSGSASSQVGRPMRGMGISLVLAGLAGEAFANDDVGLPLGATAPAFELTDQNGETRSLASLLGGGKLAVVFFRSADW